MKVMSAEQRKTGTQRSGRELEQLDPVEVPCFSTDGTSSSPRTFTPGPVSNYPNIALLKEATRRQQGRRRRGTASTRTRAEISGSNRKPWRQKGTGRARSGTRKSPIWRGGGVAFGPKPRKYDYGLPRKQRRLAVRHAILSKLLDGETRIIESLPLDKPSTDQVGSLLKKIGITGPCLIGLAEDMDKGQVRNLVLSCRNLHRIKVVPIKAADTLSLLEHSSLLLTGAAFDELQEVESNLGISDSSSSNGGAS